MRKQFSKGNAEPLIGSHQVLCESNSTQGNAEPLIGSHQVLCESNSPRKTKASAKCEALRHFLLENQMSHASHSSHTSHPQAESKARSTHPHHNQQNQQRKEQQHETESKLERACAPTMGGCSPRERRNKGQMMRRCHLRS